ncbi:MazG nucleotide pyrophosphohydrolase domain-containing protein [Janibacter melonis]|uniref:MazG nucleotide pyrophosphohydrolase domain-containing protein n=1 Tax=Janibacter melonis TaxID=262209 RepID=UPI000A04272A|nr:MazG nucleotide pyrophosphohydrolase domain-containing protein [Janibacter melonis]
MTARVVLLASSPRVAPGLLSRDAWRCLEGASSRWCRSDDEALAGAVRSAGLPVESVDEGVTPPVLARRLVAATQGGREVVWVGSADGDPGLSDALASELSALADPPEIEVLVGSWDVPGARLLDAVAVMDRLRSPGGCPWDAEQTHESLVPYALEEAEEVAEAVAGLADGSHRYEDLRDELGDLLLQVLFHARVATEAEPGPTAADAPFDIDDVAATLVAKMVRRHPHVFGDSSASTPAEVEEQWAQIKAQERADRAARREA